MLDGSLIAYAAAKVGITCTALFSDLALEAKPKSREVAQEVTALAEAACASANPDAFWVAAHIRSSFRSDIVFIAGGERLMGSRVRRLVATGEGDALLKRGINVGVFLVNYRKNKAILGETLAEALRPANQIAAVTASGREAYLASCGEAGWTKCHFLEGAVPGDFAAWKSAEVELARLLHLRLAASGGPSAPSAPASSAAP